MQLPLSNLVVGASFALYVGIALWARAGSIHEFYAAGGRVNPVMNGMATAADRMSAVSFISMAGLISGMG
jgi:cation/acetate symporter